MEHTMKTFFLTAALALAWNAFAGTIAGDPLTLVPGGEIIQLGKFETKVKTPQGTIVELDWHRHGDFEEASGDAVANGDILVPGAGLLTLAAAVVEVEKAGKKPVGDWSLEKSLRFGWVYEFQGYEAGKKMEYLIDAEDGKILTQNLDD